MTVCETRTSGGSTATVDLAFPTLGLDPWRFAEPFLGQMFLVVVDAYCKWAEVRMMGGNTQPANTIKVLRFIFASYELPEQLISERQRAPIYE